MMCASLVWGAADWLPVAAIFAGVLLVLLVWGYMRSGADLRVRLIAASLKFLGIFILLLALLEPLFSTTRAKPGANIFVMLADNSQSMKLKDRDAEHPRGQQLNALLAQPANWVGRLRQDFDLRQYAFDTQLRPLDDVGGLTFDGNASELGGALDRLVRRYHGRPLAGILLFTDGTATDIEALERVLAAASAGQKSQLPPIYPVLIGRESPASDVNLDRVAVTQTNFQDAPVTLTAHATASGYANRTLLVELLDESGKQLQQQKIRVDQDGRPIAIRFTLRPEQPGLSFYRLRVAAEDEVRQFDEPESSNEATLANNARLVAVDRGAGPYRILYVTGRPNWEFKFLQRALQEDDQVQLVGFIRIAKREPKFNFLGRAGERTNPLYRGFDNADKEQAEEYDQPVIVRIGTLDENELRGGFPKAADELYRYDAIILDDLESEFFTQDQMQLLKEFVRHRGGGLLMLGGQESFRNGRYDRTPIGDLLPVYVDDVPDNPPNARFRLALTREGWLEPWVRLRSEEQAEQQRLASMPGFEIFNQIRGIKPGATVLARAMTEGGVAVPALVEQRFGRGRAGALLIGDLWRWQLKRPLDAERDLEKAWQQAIRWLVSDVPRRVELAIDETKDPDQNSNAMKLSVTVRDDSYQPLDNAKVTVRVSGPDGKPIDLTAEPSERDPGVYETSYVPRQSGAYRAEVLAAAPDGSDVGKVQSGWTSDPVADEFHDLTPNRALLSRIAGATGGELIEVAGLEGLVSALPTRHADITEPFIRPLWHTPWVFLLALICLTAEWGLRRLRGLP